VASRPATEEGGSTPIVHRPDAASEYDSPCATDQPEFCQPFDASTTICCVDASGFPGDQSIADLEKS
jgi:hypothetical protein